MLVGELPCEKESHLRERLLELKYEGEISHVLSENGQIE